MINRIGLVSAFNVGSVTFCNYPKEYVGPRSFKLYWYMFKEKLSFFVLLLL